MIVKLNSEFIVMTEEKKNKLEEFRKNILKDCSMAQKLYREDYYGEFDSKSCDIDLIEYTNAIYDTFEKVLSIITGG